MASNLCVAAQKTNPVMPCDLPPFGERKVDMIAEWNICFSKNQSYRYSSLMRVKAMRMAEATLSTPSEPEYAFFAEL